MTPPIATPRLDLVAFDIEFHSLCLAGERAAAELHLGCAIDPEWYDETRIMRIRRDDLAHDPTLQPWLLRGMILRGENRLIGNIGFHTRPGAEYLAPYSSGVEFGYTVFSPYRRRGFAREASLSLMEWARAEHGVTRFVASVSPANIPSRNLIASLGFIRIGGHEDEEDGYEDIYELVMAPGGRAG